LADRGEHRGSAGRIDRAPAASEMISFAPSFGRRYLVFCDTEEEFDWSGPRGRDLTSTRAMHAMPAFHRRLLDHGARPTYLIDFPIASDPASVDILGGFVAAGEASIGAQLHPWVNPPYDEALTNENSFVGNLPIEVERTKLEVLTRRIALAFGEAPRIYRAGRYGVGPNTAALLEGGGYAMDVSVRAMFDYSGEGGPDFSRFDCTPFWAGPELGLVELPLTAAHTGRLRAAPPGLRRIAARLPHVNGVLARAGLLNRVALTPEGMPLGETLEALRVLLDSDMPVFSLSFHSPSVEPGHTPYVRDAADLHAFHRWWDAVLGLLARAGVTPATPAEIVDAAWLARKANR